MIFAQILNSTVVNRIVLNDPKLVPLFQSGFDAVVQIDNLPIQPNIGWAYDGVNFSDPSTLPPTPQDPGDVFNSSLDLGADIIKQFWVDCFSLGIQKSPAFSEVGLAIKSSNVDYLVSIGSLAEAGKAFLSIPLTPSMDPFLNQPVLDKYSQLLFDASNKIISISSASAVAVDASLAAIDA